MKNPIRSIGQLFKSKNSYKRFVGEWHHDKKHEDWLEDIGEGDLTISFTEDQKLIHTVVWPDKTKTESMNYKVYSDSGFISTNHPEKPLRSEINYQFIDDNNLLLVIGDIEYYFIKQR